MLQLLIIKIIMIKKLAQSFPVHFLLLLTVSFISHREVFRMYFFRDDFTLLYQLQQKIPFPYPYMHELEWFMPIYNIFKLNPTAYFSYGFIFFLVSAFIFYYFIFLLFSRKILSFIGTLIYITAPIGIDGVLEMVVFQPTYLAMNFFLLLLLLTIKFYQTQKKVYFFVLILLLLLSLEIVLFKSFFFPIIVVILGIMSFNKKTLSVKKFMLFQSIIVFFWILFLTTRMNFLATPPHRDQFVILGTLFSQPDFGSLILNPIVTSINILYALTISGIFISYIHIPLFLIILFFSIFAIRKYYKNNKKLIGLYIFSILSVYINVLAFFPMSHIQDAKGYYMSFSLPAYSLFILSVYLISLKIFKGKYVKIIPSALLAMVILINFTLNQKYLTTFNKRVDYVRPFFTQIKKDMPVLKPNSLIYFEVPTDDAEAASLLYDIYAVGRYGANAVFAVLYNIRVDQVETTKDWKETMFFVKKDPKNIEKVYGFRYDLNGLHSKIEETRMLLKKEITY